MKLMTNLFVIVVLLIAGNVCGEQKLSDADGGRFAAIGRQHHAGMTASVGWSRHAALSDNSPQGGLAVHVGCSDPTQLIALTREYSVVQGVDQAQACVDAAREAIHEANLQKRCSAVPFNGKNLPYADNLVNYLVTDASVPVEEALRVLAPGGRAVIDGEALTKPANPNDWSHFLRTPDNNAVSPDETISLPRALQWVSGKRWARSHEEFSTISAAVTAGGRLFCIVDQSPNAYISFNPNWKLVARDAHNGLKLWERDIKKWNDHMRQFRSGPAHLPRRLVAADDALYVTLGLDAPLAKLDPVTGETLHTYEGAQWCEEIVLYEDTLYLLVGSSETRRFGAGLYEKGEPRMRMERFLVAIDAKTNKELWRKNAKGDEYIMPLGVACSDGRLFYHSIQGLGCLDPKTGKEKWFVKRQTAGARYGFATSTLVATPKIVLLADRAGKKSLSSPAKEDILWGVGGWGVTPPSGIFIERKGTSAVTAYSTTDGKECWTAPCGEGYNSPADVFVINDCVWLGPFNKRVAKKDALDLMTGKVVHTIDIKGVPVGMAHDRCYRNKASVGYIFGCRDGVEVHDLENGWIRNNSWTRGPCQLGIMPANGLLYVPTDPCACHLQTRLSGYKAYTSDRIMPTHEGRLEKGPAFNTELISVTVPWPLYRHDNFRTGTTSAAVNPSVAVKWNTNLGQQSTQPIVGASHLFATAGNTVYALDSKIGDHKWHYITGGEIDSSPTWYQGRLLFGSADGNVYCLDAKSGKLAWRFQAADERTIVSYGQLASTWPIHGSVLAMDDEVFFTAGTSSYLGGGLLYYRLNIKTGEMINRSVITYIDPKTEEYIGTQEARFRSDGIVSDILSSNGNEIFLKHLSVSKDGNWKSAETPHLFSPTSLLHEEWYVRSYWTYGESILAAGWGGWGKTGGANPSGRIMSFTKDRIYGFGRRTYISGSTGHRNNVYRLYAMSLPKTDQVDSSVASAAEKRRKSKKPERPSKSATPPKNYLWEQAIPCTARAMVATPAALIVAGVPDLGKRSGEIDTEGKNHNRLEFTNPEEALAAFEGKEGGELYIVSLDDGTVIKKMDLPASPRHDGMIAANRQIFISLKNGEVICLAEKE